MSNKGITIWLILLTAWVGITDLAEHNNLKVRNRQTEIRNQRYENLGNSLEQYLNGPLREELNEIKKYMHEH
jgi:hypothetical protein